MKQYHIQTLICFLSIIFLFPTFTQAQKWVQMGKNIEGEEGDHLGSSISLSADGKTVAVGAEFGDGNGKDSGRISAYFWNGSRWVQKGGNLYGRLAGEHFGFSLSLSSDGQVLASGVIGSKEGAHVEVYTWNDSMWLQKGKDIELDWQISKIMGLTVSLSSDGNVIVIGDQLDEYVAVYDWDGNAWKQRGESISGEFGLGHSVSIATNGNTIAMGNNLRGEGKIYFWDNNAWVQKGNSIQGQSPEGGMGYSLDISSDGNIFIIGSYIQGYIQVYEWDEINSKWIQKGKDLKGLMEADFWGFSVAMSSDGNMIAIGAPRYNESLGLVQVYEWKNANWEQVGQNIKGEEIGDSFGSSISLSADGNTIAIGANSSDKNKKIKDAGHIQIFQLEY